MTMNLEISCYIVKENLVICQISIEVTIWMRICQHMYDQTVKAHGFLNNTLIFSLHMEPTIVKDDQDKEVGGAEIDGLVVGVVDEHVEKPKQQRKWGPTIIFYVTRVQSEGERKLVEYNEDGVPIGENRAKLNSFIGSCVHYHIPIIYATWIDVPAELKEKIYTIVKSILKTAKTTFRQFKHWLTKKYILPFKNEHELLKRPPYMYSYIDQKQWEEFVRSRLCPHFEDKRKLEQKRRKKNKYNHRLSRKGYTNLREELKNIPLEESELDRASMWKKARVDKKGQYDNEDVQEVVNRIDEISKTCVDKEPSPNDILTQALELENIHISTQSTPTLAHGSCSRPRLEYDIQCKKILEKEVVKEEMDVDVIILNDLQKDAIEVMDKDSGIRYQLPFLLFGIGRKTCVLREDIIDFCNMREVKTLTLVAYMAGHWALLAINAYNETVYFLDSLRTTLRVDIRYVTDTAITIFRS
ncbi:putative serine/threonine-protein kinase nek2 [Cucumis melo var. makuwa]|uniref:Putative serine/threonine-protein kinase nek2 n=1 Tax=Cucumis melo var. makuwa TaxID=1194695 RepID=A0A5D3E3Y9_CUCMM|nr:putative serine/threonine-protein kinase nek2 [Cucumis melo var. makuwa]